MGDLILVPTEREMEIVKHRLLDDGFSGRVSFQLCGFGPIAAAARTGALLARYKPERVLLVGIAGSYVDRLAVGTASRFDSVVCDGVGVGVDTDFQSAADLGWDQFHGGQTKPRVGDMLALDSAYVKGIPSAGLLLTGCAASASRGQAEWRMKRFPLAVAEDMEGFAVAMACLLAGVPLQIVRGISNRTGDRNHRNWKVDEALEAAGDLAGRLIPQTWMPIP